MPSRFTDPIRDPELTRGEAEAMVNPPPGTDPEYGEWYEAQVAASRKLKAALEDSPTQPRYTLEEFAEKVLGAAAVERAVLSLPSISREWWAELDKSEKDNIRNEFRTQAEAAIDAAFKEPK